jgi:hypothetical protein
MGAVIDGGALLVTGHVALEPLDRVNTYSARISTLRDLLTIC